MAEGFRIAKGYVEVSGEPDRRSVKRTAELITAGVSQEITTGTPFANSRDAGRKFGAMLGIHGAPSAAREVSAGAATWIARGQASATARHAGEAFGTIIGVAGAPKVAREIVGGTATIHTRSEVSEAGANLGRVMGARARDTFGSVFSGRDDGGDFTRVIGGGTDRDTDHRNSLPGIPGDKDRDKKEAERRGSLLGRLFGGAFGQGSEGARGLFLNMLSSFTGNPVVSTIGTGLGVVVAIAAGSAISAGISAAIIGGVGLGVLGIGVAIAARNPIIQKAFGDLGKTASGVFGRAVGPFIEPLRRSLGMVENFLVRMEPAFTEIFATLAPVIEPLTRGLLGMVEGMLPGLFDLIEASVPFLMSLEDILPRFGKDLGSFFSVIADGGPGATAFLRDFLNVAGLIILILAEWINWGSKLYGELRIYFDGILELLRESYLGWQIMFNGVMGFLGRLKDFVTGVVRSFDIDFGGFIKFLKGLPGQVGDIIGSTIARIKGPFDDAANWLRDAGAKIINSLIGGIKDAVPALTSTLHWITQMIPDWKGPMDVDKQLLVPTGRAIIGGLGEGFRQGSDSLHTELSALTRAIPGMAAPAAPGGGMTVNINIYAAPMDDIPRTVVAKIDSALDRYRRNYR